MAGAAEFESDWVLYDIPDRHIARITLNRPERRNAVQYPDMHEAITAALRRAEDDDDVKVVIFTGAGEHFCAGEDVRQTPVETFGLAKGKRLPQSERIRGITKSRGGDFLLADKAVIAAVRGAAMGLGFKLALSCDLIVASDEARFGRPQTRIGLAGFDPYLPIVLLKLGINRGYEALITGRTISVSELREWGVVASVVPTGELEDESLRYAKAVSNHSTDGLMLGRKAMQMFWSMMGLAEWNAFVEVAHPLFTNLVWREDEANLFKERSRTGGAAQALKAVYRRWEELGFE